eukprot:CAMPEP_0169091640 /NCGR_PEP_ID=MMETSP1015-20121227/16479_1 /TAXON_ID=342587 /ORGANISM="Karlodinium micrum, Strain CCMP2283" /LENGTH=290 /DNA_ID=CAMNT_0009152163 /DNA_START=44 /DNA_END=916 /DNA_ORIENTATION=+
MTQMTLGAMHPQDLQEIEETLMPHLQAFQDALQESWPSLDPELLLLHYLCLRLDLRPPSWWPAHVKRPIVSCMSRPNWEHGMSLMAGSGMWKKKTGVGTRRWNPGADRSGRVRGSALPCSGIGLHAEHQSTMEGARSVAYEGSMDVVARTSPDFDHDSFKNGNPDEQRMQSTTPSTFCDSRPESRLSSAPERPESRLSDAEESFTSVDTWAQTSTKKASSRQDKPFLSDDRWKTHIPQSWPRCGPSVVHYEMQRPRSASTSTAARIGNRQSIAGQPSDKVMLRFESAGMA